tara:strand:+ start:55 stop:771 length:717 start_codon:yes stop_codon:yes gene_type:complete|eukprot:scaffold85951_cov53-Phaeocystis_antarctica.AAC.2
MMYKSLFLVVGVLTGQVAAAPTEAPAAKRSGNVWQKPEAMEGSEAITRGRELFPIYALKNKCSAYCASAASSRTGPVEMVSTGQNVKVVKALEMLALNDDLNTVVKSDHMCTRRSAMARAAGLAFGLSMAAVGAPGFAAETKSVKMGSDSGQLVFVPDEVKICKGDSITWINNKGGPHNVVFVEDAIPKGVSAESISMDDQLGDEGDVYTKKFDTPGSYEYYCEPHAGGGMKAVLIVE